MTFNDVPEIFEISNEHPINASDGPNSEPKQSKNLTINSATDCSLPYVVATLENLPLKCLIDTGSSANILNFRCLKNLNNIAVTQTTVQLCGINKSPVDVHGESQVDLMIGGKRCPVDVIIASIHADVVLGNPFIKQYSALVNLKQGLLTIPDDPMINVQINTVQQALPTEDNSNTMPVPDFKPLTARCTADITIPAHHAGWVPFEIDQPDDCPNVLLFPCIHYCADAPGQLLSREPDGSTYNMLMVNTTDTSVDFNTGDELGLVDQTPIKDQIQIELTAEPMDKNLTVNSTYDLDLSESDRDLRWTELCKVLKVDTWEISEDQKQTALKALKEFEFVFALENEPLGLLHDYYHEIDVGDTPPISLRPRPLSEDKHQAVKEIIDDLLKRGLIRPSRSPWSAPIVLAKKPGDGSWRLCCDWRKLNMATKRDAFPLPHISNMLSTLKQSKFFSTADLAQGFHQIQIQKSSIPLTAFCTPDALYEWVVLPFGVCNGPPSFVRAMSQVLKLPKSEALVYFDDILILGKSFECHVKNLVKVLSALKNSNLKVKGRKCRLFALKIDFLGHVISEQGVACSPEKIACIKNTPIPDSPKSLRSYLGVFSYYRRFCPKYSEIAAPLFKLAVADKKDFKWSPEANSAFLELQSRLSNPPILTLPTDDDKFILTTDASGIAIGSILTVDRPEGRKVICYASHLLEKSRRQYPATKRELYSVVFYVQKFRMFLLPRHFIVESDHNCLRNIASFKDPPAIIARWLAILSDYSYSIVHRPKSNSLIRVADFLSRPFPNNQSLPLATNLEDNFLTPLSSDIVKSACDTTAQASTSNTPTNSMDNDVNNFTNDHSAEDHSTIDKNFKFGANVVTTQTITTPTVNVVLVEDIPTHTVCNQLDDPMIANLVTCSSANMNQESYPATTQLPADNEQIDPHTPAPASVVSTIEEVKTPEDDNDDTDVDDTYYDAQDYEQAEDRQAQITEYIKQISTAQNSDKNIKLLLKRLSESADASIFDISSDPPTVKFYWAQKHRLHVENNVLYFADSKRPGKYRIVVPHNKIKDLLKLAHDDQTAGHRSANKMLPLLKRSFHFFKMRSLCESHVKQCLSCGAHKKPRSNRPRAPLYQTKVSSRFEILSIDFAGPFNRTQRGNKFILLGLCCFTKFGFCIPMSNTDSEHVARALIERWICYFGTPIQIKSDAGSNLTSDVIKHLYKLLNIKQTKSLSYVPQQNGQAERLVSTMKNMMCHFAASKPSQWDFYAPLVCLAYNSQVHASTKCTPQEMVMGPDPVRLPLDFAWGAPPIVEDIDEPDYVAFLREAMYDIHDYALTNLNTSLATSKDRFDKGQFGKPYKKGDLVWRLKGRFDAGSRKWQKRYDGVFIVVEQLSNTSYHIKHLKNHREEIIHFNRLKPASLDPFTLKTLLQQMEKSGASRSDPETANETDEPIIIGVRSNLPPQPAAIQIPPPVVDQQPQINLPPPIPPRPPTRQPSVQVRTTHNYNLRPRPRRRY